MIHERNDFFIESFVFTFATMILVPQLSLSNDVFGLSPPFVRQEIQDGMNDVILIDDNNHTITNLIDSCIEQEGNSLDIRAIYDNGKYVTYTALVNIDKATNEIGAILDHQSNSTANKTIIPDIFSSH